MQVLERAKSKFLVKWYFILPAIIFFIIMIIFPMTWALRLSFFNWHAILGPKMNFIGLGNFYDILKDERFWEDLAFTLFYVGMVVIIELFLGLGLASLLNRKFRFRNFFRIIYLLPMTAPPIAVAALWRMFLQPDLGVINKLLVAVGLPLVKWTTDPGIARISLVIVDVWQWTPFMLLALLAALQSMPQEIYDAAVVDGASPGQTFLHITLPLLSPIITTLILLRAIDAFKLFEYTYGITGGGPAGKTESLSYYIYLRGLSYFDMGYASALSWVFLLIVLGICLFVLKIMRREMR